jgi:hypothetical protein
MSTLLAWAIGFTLWAIASRTVLRPSKRASPEAHFWNGVATILSVAGAAFCWSIWILRSVA